MGRPTQDAIASRLTLIATGFNRCGHCKEVKALSEFGKRKQSMTGYATRCRSCTNSENARLREKKGEDAHRSYMREYHRKRRTAIHADPVLKAQAARSQRSAGLKHRYGLTADQIDEMWSAQGHACAICREPVEKFHVDHCHGSGLVRGLLCGPCNKGIGQLKDDLGVLRSAVAYLEKFAGDPYGSCGSPALSHP